MMRPLTAAAITALAILPAAAQTAAQRYADYIERYAPMAVEQMERYGIPASITLAQGLLESAAGASTLATQGNNHFGIKCGGRWDGESMLRSDDAPDECFRVYRDAADSFEDHSRFLTQRRYRPLFELDPTDYAAWARTLRECGYATDPNYADRLIAIIERYSLMGYDTPGTAAPDFIIEAMRSVHPVRRTRGLHYVVAAPGDTYSLIAGEYGLPLEALLSHNDATADGEIRPWQEVYLQPKHTSAPRGLKTCTIGEDESMHTIAQRYAITLQALRALNPNAPDTPGTVLRMQ